PYAGRESEHAIAAGDSLAAQAHAGHGCAHGMLSHAPMNDASVVAAGFEVASVLYDGVVRHSQVRGTTYQHWHMRSECIDDFPAGDTRGHCFSIFEAGELFLPVFRQITIVGLAPELSQLSVLALKALHQIVPLALMLRAAFDSFAIVCERFVRNIELFVFRPVEMPLCFAHGIFSGRI